MSEHDEHENEDHVPLPGTEPLDVPEDLLLSTVDLAERARVTLVLRRHRKEKLDELIAEHAARLPHERRHLGDDERAELARCPEADVAAVKAFAEARGLEVVEADPASRSVVLEGTLEDLAGAFGVEWTHHHRSDGRHRTHRGAVRLPRLLARLVESVTGFDCRPNSFPLLVAGFADQKEIEPFDPTAMVEAYDFPEEDGTGECIALVELGGGFHMSDVEAFCKMVGIPTPKITVIGVGARAENPNQPADPEFVMKSLQSAGVQTYPVDAVDAAGADDHAGSADEPHNSSGNVSWTIETTTNVELAAALVPGAEILVAIAPDSSNESKRQIFNAIIADPRKPSVASCSWGSLATSLSDNDREVMESILKDAAAAEISVFFASGNYGDGTDKFTGGKGKTPVVLYPAASPLAAACGGTILQSPSEAASRQTVFNQVWGQSYRSASGGGVAEWVDPPSWQASADVAGSTGKKGRGLPDVASKADMNTGYSIVVGGEKIAIGGTSSAAPLWASLVARINQALRKKSGDRVGYLTPLVYREDFREAFTMITEGDNGTFKASTGRWCACTGWGTPKGKALLTALGG